MDVEIRLANVLSEFGRTLVPDLSVQGVLDVLADRVVDVVPVSAAGVVVMSAGVAPWLVGASDDSARHFESLQSELREGPCVAAFETGLPVAVPDLRADDRFPSFAPRAVAAGLAGVFTFPLRHGATRLGALDLYRSTTGLLEPEELAAAQTLADVAAARVLDVQAWADASAALELAHHNALHDPLTLLANRALFVRRLEDAAARCRRTGKIAAVLYADLDEFKSVNDTYGHHVGDELLVAVADRLTGRMQPGETVARFGGDEFVVLCEGLDDAGQVASAIWRIETAMSEPFRLSVVDLRISASIGVAFLGGGTERPDEVLQAADSGMYEAKRKGGAAHVAVDRRAGRPTSRRSDLRHDLQDALARGELRTEFEPIVDPETGKVRGVEALLRWVQPVGRHPRARRQPLAGHYGLVADIGCYLFVDVSPEAPWADQVDRAPAVEMLSDGMPEPVAKAGVAPPLVPEAVFTGEKARALDVLESLLRVGVRLALDELGAGREPVGALEHRSIDIVEIDRLYVEGLGQTPLGQRIVAAIIELEPGPDPTIVGAGSNAAGHHAHATAIGSGTERAFYFSRPTTAADLDALFAHHA